MKIVTIEEINNRIEKTYPNEPFKVIEYTQVTKPFSIQCLKCGETKTFSSCRNFLLTGSKSRKHLCSCYTLNNNLQKHKINQNKIIDLCLKNEKIEFLSFGYKEKTKKHTVNILCKECNQVFNKDFETFLVNQNCPFCDSRHNLNTKGFELGLPQEYTLISEYINTETKVLIKHECGFIWKVKPHNFIQKINSGYSGCPHCNHKRSKGEVKIATWLKNHSIIFIEEQIFSWSSNHKFRYDFYLPKNNLIIEYMGEQHYKEVNFFHDTLSERQEHDKIKEKEAKEHNFDYLIIPYTEFQNIETILSDWFNDYLEKE